MIVSGYRNNLEGFTLLDTAMRSPKSGMRYDAKTAAYDIYKETQEIAMDPVIELINMK